MRSESASSTPALVATLAFVTFVALTCERDARAESPFLLEPSFSLTISLGAVVGTLSVSTLEAEHAPWRTEILGGVDSALHGEYRPVASSVSDVALGVLVLSPALLFLGQGFDDDSLRALLLYAETQAVALFANNVTKRLVHRPRPYTYDATPAASERMLEGDCDPWLSFYSGHASAAFASAVAGSLLFAARSSDPVLIPAIFGSTLTLAGATATLRVKAGKHFPSDVVFGALVGTALGAAIPLSQMESPEIGWTEVGAGVAGVALGAALALLVPFPENVAVTPSGLSARF
ncbi:MAG: phosphatase PAP2 family protein [Deltaproteobacteria bacterium]|nr:phosphatase PAP2 family protein [Deltaproteobacteria bacterium]